MFSPVFGPSGNCRRNLSRLLSGVALVLSLTNASTGMAQPAIPVSTDLLAKVFPQAARFSGKAGSPPVYTAFADSAEDSVIGYVFETKDYPPEEVGYSAPIEVLVGIDIQGQLTGIEVLYYRESYKSIRGDFLATERFPNQFESKSIGDGFRVGRDIDGVSRATITSWAVSRGIRNAGRRVAENYLPDFAGISGSDAEKFALEILASKSWADLEEDGFVVGMIVPQPEDTALQLSFVFMGHDGLGELLIGVNDYSVADREASNRAAAGNLLLVGIDGDSSKPFRQERLAIEQHGERYPIRRTRFVYAGSADTGLIADQVRYAGALVLPPEIDLALPFEVLYDTSESIGSYLSYTGVEYKISSLAYALATGSQIPAEYLPEPPQMFAEPEGVFASLLENAAWTEVAALLVLFGLVSVAFWQKSTTIRWLALSTTLIYLGFVDGGFVSVSHITNGIKLGPSMFLNDLPLLMILVFTVVTTLFWGRVFCSSLCPFGALQDLITRLVPKKIQLTVPRVIHDIGITVKYVVLAFLVVMAVAYSELSLFQYFEPFGTIFYFSQSLTLWLILFAFLIGTVLVPRFYCRYACPLGAALGIASILSPFKIKRVEQCQVCKVCEHACPTGAIRGPDIDFKECVRCDLCEIKLIEEAGVCKHNIDVVKSRVKEWQPVTLLQS